MENILTVMITTVVGGVLVLFFEYFVLKPDTARRRFALAVILTTSLFLPLIIIQFFLVGLFGAMMGQQPQSVRIDWFANSYAVVAMLWGWLWGVRIRPVLNRHFEKEG